MCSRENPAGTHLVNSCQTSASAFFNFNRPWANRLKKSGSKIFKRPLSSETMQPLNRNRVFLIAGLTLTGVLAGAAWFQTHPPDSEHPGSSRESSKAALNAGTGRELKDESLTPDERGFSQATATLQTNSGTIR